MNLDFEAGCKNAFKIVFFKECGARVPISYRTGVAEKISRNWFPEDLELWKGTSLQILKSYIWSVIHTPR